MSGTERELRESQMVLGLEEEVVGATIPDEGLGLRAAPGKEPQTPAEWAKANLFSGPFNSVVTIVAGFVSAWTLYQLFKYVFISADWTILKVNARSYMTGRWPLEQMWRIWLCIYGIGLLAGIARGVLPLRFAISRRRVAGLVPVLGFALLVELYVVDTLLVHALLAGVVAVIGIGVWIGCTFGSAIKGKALLYAWIAAFPLVILVLRFFGGVSERLWGGFMVNLIVAVVAIVASFPIGVLLALGRRGSLPIIRLFSVNVIEIVRGAPLYTLLIFGVFVLPLMLPPGIGKPPNIILAMIVFTLFSSVYVAEIVRGGLQGVHEGQYEAARALGLPVRKIMRLVILPQALRSTIPAMISHFISLFKDTSLLATIAILELLRQARRASAALGFAGKSLEALLPAALLFWIVAFSMARWSQRLEKRLGVGER
jgi:general L-amino acid transport system permease protein